MAKKKSNRNMLVLASTAIVFFAVVLFTINNPDPTATLTPTQSVPIKLNPVNPHYFLYKGNPEVLIGSNEHYGAVLNLDFDYDIYLNEIQSKGLNYVRIFSGTYIEPDPNMGSYWDIDDNTLAPTNNGLITPWMRSNTPGFAGDSNSYKFDLSTFDQNYFNRLKDFVKKADGRGIVVEYVFFTPYWTMPDKITPLHNMWDRSPLNSKNNVNNAGNTSSWNLNGKNMVWDINSNDGLTPYIGDMVTKVVTELNQFNNVIFQPCIECYSGDGGTTMETTFEDFVISKIRSADSPKKHLISQGRDNVLDITKNIKPAVDVFSFDAGSNTAIATTFYSLNKPMVNDEDAYLGRGEVNYRRAAWNWMIKGGATFNNLDLSFTQYGHEDGSKTMPYKTSTGGTRLLGGGALIRQQLGILNKFMHSFDFVKMKPDSSVVSNILNTVTLSESGKQYAIYVPSGTNATVTINLPSGNYKSEWINTRTGTIDKTEIITGGSKTLISPGYIEDIALRIVKI